MMTDPRSAQPRCFLHPAFAAVAVLLAPALSSAPALAQGISCENEALIARIPLEVKDVSTTEPWQMAIEGDRLYTRGMRIEGTGLATFVYELTAEAPPMELGSWPDEPALKGAAYSGTLVYELLADAGGASFRVRDASAVGSTAIVSTIPLPAEVGPSPTLHFGGGNVAFIATQTVDKFWGV